MICICIEVTKTTQKKNHSPFLNCTVKAKNECYLLKRYTFRCFGNARKLHSHVTERQIFNLFVHKISKQTIQKTVKPCTWCRRATGYLSAMGQSPPSITKSAQHHTLKTTPCKRTKGTPEKVILDFILSPLKLISEYTRK